MAKIRNMHWWTVEYGLIGTIDEPKIYGAGLLSSIGESKWCMSDRVKKLPYTIDTSNIGFDITKPQPQLFVTPDFAHLSFVLEEFANKMALRNGGLKGVEKLIDSKDLGTIELSTGIQISGKFSSVIADENQRPVYINTIGPTALAYKNKELIGHDKEYHIEGFGSPIGKLRGINIAIEDMSPTDLEAYGIYEGKSTKLEFERGVIVQGEIITGKRNLQGKIILISFKNCTVKIGDKILFDPTWGIYDMAVGASVTSIFSGIADPNSYGLLFEPPKEKTHKINYSSQEIELHKLYGEVRKVRESNKINSSKLEDIFENLRINHPEDWLLALEIFELVQIEKKSDLKNKVKTYLNKLSKKDSISHLIQDGIEIINANYNLVE
jgi:phenylalanine-4-hydroxylase